MQLQYTTAGECKGIFKKCTFGGKIGLELAFLQVVRRYFCRSLTVGKKTKVKSAKNKEKQRKRSIVNDLFTNICYTVKK